MPSSFRQKVLGNCSLLRHFIVSKKVRLRGVHFPQTWLSAAMHHLSPSRDSHSGEAPQLPIVTPPRIRLRVTWNVNIQVYLSHQAECMRLRLQSQQMAYLLCSFSPDSRKLSSNLDKLISLLNFQNLDPQHSSFNYMMGICVR